MLFQVSKDSDASSSGLGALERVTLECLVFLCVSMANTSSGPLTELNLTGYLCLSEDSGIVVRKDSALPGYCVVEHPTNRLTPGPAGYQILPELTGMLSARSCVPWIPEIIIIKGDKDVRAWIMLSAI